MLVSGVQHNDLIFVYIVKGSPQKTYLTSITTHSYKIYFLEITIYAFFIFKVNLSDFGCISDYEGCVNARFL